MSAEQHAEPGYYRDQLKWAGGWIALGALLAFLLLYTAHIVLAPLIFAMFLYYGTRPIFVHLVRFGIPRKAAALISLLSVGLPSIAVMLSVVVAGIQEAIRLIEQGAIPELGPSVADSALFQQLQEVTITDFGTVIDFLSSEPVREAMTNSWGTVSTLTNTAVGLLLSLALVFAFAFFMFGWGPRIRKKIEGLSNDPNLPIFFECLDDDLSTVFFGNMLNAVATALIAAISYAILNYAAGGEVLVPAPILLGLLTGIASFIPVTGSKTVYIPLAGWLAAQSYLTAEVTGYGFALLFLIVSFIIVDTVPDMFLRPLISGRSISQGALFVSYLIGPLVFGFVGVFLLPIITVVTINFAQVILPGFAPADSDVS